MHEIDEMLKLQLEGHHSQARVLSDNLKSFPEANKKAAFVALKAEVKRLRDASIANANKADRNSRVVFFMVIYFDVLKLQLKYKWYFNYLNLTRSL